MFATANEREASLTALPVCLIENSYRLVSLLDIVNHFKADKLAYWIRMLEIDRCGLQRRLDSGVAFDQKNDSATLRMHIEATATLCHEVGFWSAWRKLQTIGIAIGDGRLRDASGLAVEARHALEAVMDELDIHKFLVVSQDRAQLIDNSELLGEKVRKAFPSALSDIVMRRNRSPRHSQVKPRPVSRIPGGVLDDANRDRILACIGNGGIPTGQRDKQRGIWGARQKQPGDLRVL